MLNFNIVVTRLYICHSPSSMFFSQKEQGTFLLIVNCVTSGLNSLIKQRFAVFYLIYPTISIWVGMLEYRIYCGKMTINYKLI